MIEAAVFATLCAACYGAGLLCGFKRWFPIPVLHALKTRIAGDFPSRSGLRPASYDGKKPERFGIRVLAIGQSHAGASGETFGPKASAFDLSILDGSVQPLRDPILNIAESGGSVWTRLAKRITEYTNDDVLFCSAAVAGVSIKRWIPGGDLHERLEMSRRAFSEPPTHILIWIGERDAELGMSAVEFEANLQTLIASLRQFGRQAPVFVARSTFSWNKVSDAIREAQGSRIYPDVFPGLDTDQLGLILSL